MAGDIGTDDGTSETTGREATTALRALAHPVRLQMLSLLTGAELSAAEVARELGLTHANASYHLRVLAEAGEVVVAGEEKIRGGVAKRYRHPWDRDRHPGRRRSSVEERQAHARAHADALVRRSLHVAPRTRASFTDAEMWVSPEVWSEVFELVGRASTLIHSEAQPPRTEGTLHVNMSAALFQMEQ